MTLTASVALRTALLSGIWWALLEGRTYLWPAAVPALAAALAASLVLSPPTRAAARLRLRALPAFAAFFVAGSVGGAADVAARALGPRVRLEPTFLEYGLRLPAGAPRHLFAATVSLLPGTLSVRLEGPILTVHVLDARLPTAVTLARLERRVGALFQQPPPATGDGRRLS